MKELLKNLNYQFFFLPVLLSFNITSIKFRYANMIGEMHFDFIGLTGVCCKSFIISSKFMLSMKLKFQIASENVDKNRKFYQKKILKRAVHHIYHIRFLHKQCIKEIVNRCNNMKLSKV